MTIKSVAITQRIVYVFVRSHEIEACIGSWLGVCPTVKGKGIVVEKLLVGNDIDYRIAHIAAITGVYAVDNFNLFHSGNWDGLQYGLGRRLRNAVGMPIEKDGERGAALHRNVVVGINIHQRNAVKGGKQVGGLCGKVFR